MPDIRSGAALIAEERQRQIDQEGYTLEHDKGHMAIQLLEAANCYILSSKRFTRLATENWPWAPETFKPTTPRRDLVKAGALIAAAIDRLDADA